MMRDVAVYKASRIGEQEVQSLRLTAHAEVPDHQTLEMAAAVYDREGAEIAGALVDHLPAGTVDAVLRHLLLKRASLLRVPLDLRRARHDVPAAALHLVRIVASEPCRGVQQLGRDCETWLRGHPSAGRCVSCDARALLSEASS